MTENLKVWSTILGMIVVIITALWNAAYITFSVEDHSKKIAEIVQEQKQHSQAVTLAEERHRSTSKRLDRMYNTLQKIWEKVK